MCIICLRCGFSRASLTGALASDDDDSVTMPPRSCECDEVLLLLLHRY